MRFFVTILIILPIQSFAFSDLAKQIVLIKMMQNNQQKQLQQENQKVYEFQVKDRQIDGFVQFAQADEGGQSVAIFDTKECGKLGYVPSQYSLAKELENNKKVRLKVENCEIKEVQLKP